MSQASIPHTWLINLNHRDKPFSDVKVRTAASLAINREALARDILKGTALAATQLEGPGGVAYDASLKGWPFDPAVVTDMRERYRLMFCNDMGADTEAFLDKLGKDHWPTLAAVQETNWPYDHLSGMPATYVVCLKDQILPVPWQERFAARHHATRLVRIDAGHQAMNTRPQAIAEILRQEGS